MGSTGYAAYLGLPVILGAQHPLTGRGEEQLFIVMHQTAELWLKQLLAEADAAQARLEGGDIAAAIRPLQRMVRIQDAMNAGWDVLATLTPDEYSGFRPGLGSGSGFQSAQFRALEFRIGLKESRFLGDQPAGSPEALLVQRCFERPSLDDAALLALYAAGLTGDTAWRDVYADPDRHRLPHLLGELLVDIDERLMIWRSRHLMTVERIMGMKPGTGGSDGVPYLQQTLQRRAFPKLWAVRTKI